MELDSILKKAYKKNERETDDSHESTTQENTKERLQEPKSKDITEQYSMEK